MVKTIQLQKFDDNFEDYFDSENQVFVLYAGTAGLKDMNIYTDIKIKDYNEVVWDCYLWSVEYISKFDMYEIKYKKY